MDPILTPFDAYEDDEICALVRYGISSEALNSALRQGDASNPDVSLLDSAITRRRFTRRQRLVAGTSRAAFWEFVSRIDFRYPAFLSTTDRDGLERKYYSADAPARLVIDVAAGTPAVYVDDVERAGNGDREYVLPRGQHFQVVEQREVTDAREVRAITGWPNPPGTTLLDVVLRLSDL